MVEERRSLGMLILLNIITCGLYSWYFYYALARDMNTVCYGDGEETPGLGLYILFSLLTCGIYSFYCFYKIGNRQAANGQKYNIHIQENGTAVLVWLILGTWFFFVGYFVAMHIIIKNMNALAHEYNKRNSNSIHSPYMNNNAPLPPVQGGPAAPAHAPAESYAPTVAMTQGDAAGTVSISCIRGEFAGNDFPLSAGESIIIGRDNSCNIRFDSNTPNLSRRHCMINYDGNTVWLTDMGSSFGTYLSDGTRLVQGQRVPVKSGEVFCLGSENISFCRR